MTHSRAFLSTVYLVDQLAIAPLQNDRTPILMRENGIRRDEMNYILIIKHFDKARYIYRETNVTPFTPIKQNNPFALISIYSND